MSTVEPFGTWQYAHAVCVPAGRAARVEQALLREQHVRPLGQPAGLDVAFGRGDLGERATEVDGRRARAVGVRPRDRTVERPVDLEHAGPVPELGRASSRSGSAASRRRARSPGAASRRAAPHRRPAVRRASRPGRSHSTRPPSALQHADERVGDLLRPAPRQRPPDEVGEHAEHQSVAGGDRRLRARGSSVRRGRRTVPAPRRCRTTRGRPCAPGAARRAP